MNEKMNEVHPATANLLRHFEYSHLPQYLQGVSSHFHYLAHRMVERQGMQGPEVTAGLRKLLEAKDCFVRAAVEASPSFDGINEVARNYMRDQETQEKT